MATNQREIYLTTDGLAKLEAELGYLRGSRRQEVARRIQEAKEIGGTADNAEYDEVKNQQAFVEGRILTIETMIEHAVVVSSRKKRAGTVQLGSKVTVENHQGKEQQYTIVGRVEADPVEGKISNESPVGDALIGRRKGDRIEAQVPAGTINLRIIKVD